MATASTLKRHLDGIVLNEQRLVFRVHALQRMFERGIDVHDVKEALLSGEIIEEYPEDQPFPSRLVLAIVRGRAMHVVVATNLEENENVVITVYEPDADKWRSDFRRRKAP